MKVKNHLVEIGVSAKQWLVFLLAVILALGIFFRFVNLDKKPIWGDEAHTFYPEVSLLFSGNICRLSSFFALGHHRSVSSF